MNKSRLLTNKKAIYTILIAGILVLMLLNFWGWIFVRGVETQLLQQLSQQWKRNSDVYALQISEKFIFEDLGFPRDEIRLIPLQQLLYEFQRTGELAHIFIVSLDRSRFITPDLDANGQAAIRDFALNDSLFQKASLGRESFVERIKFSNQYFLTTYTPIVDVGVATAILIVDARADIFDTLTFFRQTLLYTGVAGILIIGLFAALIVMSIRRLFQIQEKLYQQSRLAQLGQMAAMVAHEIRNPLSIIKGSAEVLRKKYRGQGDELFDFIPDEINRLNRLVSDFLQFARHKTLALKLANPNEMIETLVKQFNDPRIELALTNPSPLIKISDDAFKQVLLNIIENARQSTPEKDKGGAIIIKSRLVNRPKRLCIEITDNGKGMSAETVQHIFEPFFSTRATGSGLGMAITQQLVTQMNGEITVDSEEGHGAVVTLFFPVKI